MWMLYAFSILGESKFLENRSFCEISYWLSFQLFFLVIYSEKFSMGRFSYQVEKEFPIGGQNTILFQDVVQD